MNLLFELITKKWTIYQKIINNNNNNNNKLMSYKMFTIMDNAISSLHKYIFCTCIIINI